MVRLSQVTITIPTEWLVGLGLLAAGLAVLFLSRESWWMLEWLGDKIASWFSRRNGSDGS